MWTRGYVWVSAGLEKRRHAGEPGQFVMKERGPYQQAEGRIPRGICGVGVGAIRERTAKAVRVTVIQRPEDWGLRRLAND